MYLGGTDEKAMHHLFAEVIDNAMCEALAGHPISDIGTPFFAVTHNTPVIWGYGKLPPCQEGTL